MSRPPFATREISFAEGRFIFDEPESGQGQCDDGVSSGAKWAYRGCFHRFGDTGDDTPDSGVPAIAVYSCRNNDICLKREMAALGQGEFRGFGPSLLANAEAARPDDPSQTQLTVAIEQDAGISLARALGGATIPGLRPTVLAAANTPEGACQTAKILFDITCQMYNMHRCGLFHHDFKSANVCVRSIGDEPWDIRATIIDFERAMHDADGRYVQSTPSYFHLLFRRLVNPAKVESDYTPSSLERDLGCLALVWCEVMFRTELRYGRVTRSCSLADEQLRVVLERKRPFFWYEDGVPRARGLDFYTDLEPLARKAHLLDADELSLPFEVQHAASLFKCVSYFDAECLRGLKEAHEENLGHMEDSIARVIFENYSAHVAADGDEVKYRDFDAQPFAYRYSNYAQAAGFVSHIWRLGLELVSVNRCNPEELLDEFDESQIELLSRWEHERWMEERLQTGWTLGETPDGRSDPQRRISPSLVPYDELDEKMRSYDEAPMRQMIPILRSRGLGIRPRRTR